MIAIAAARAILQHAPAADAAAMVDPMIEHPLARVRSLALDAALRLETPNGIVALRRAVFDDARSVRELARYELTKREAPVDFASAYRQGVRSGTVAIASPHSRDWQKSAHVRMSESSFGFSTFRMQEHRRGYRWHRTLRWGESPRGLGSCSPRPLIGRATSSGFVREAPSRTGCQSTTAASVTRAIRALDAESLTKDAFAPGDRHWDVLRQSGATPVERELLRRRQLHVHGEKLGWRTGYSHRQRDGYLGELRPNPHARMGLAFGDEPASTLRQGVYVLACSLCWGRHATTGRFCVLPAELRASTDGRYPVNMRWATCKCPSTPSPGDPGRLGRGV